MTNREPGKAEILQGTLDLMVLQTLAALGPVHGYAIAARWEQVSAGALRLNMGTLYLGLMRLAHRDAHSREPDTRAVVVESRGIAQAVEALRDQRGLPWLDDVLRDVRHACRLLRRDPGFATVAILSLALGIGANTAIFQLMDAV